jgi:ribosomal protein S18 acetylase RimI-like enzyme
MTCIVVRSLTLADADKAAKVHVQTFHDTYRGMIPAEQLNGMTVEAMMPRWQHLIGANEAGLILLGAFDDEVLLGVSGAGRPREACGYDAELWSMNVPLSNQRRNVGRELFHASVERLLAEGRHSMFLYCIDKNVNALNFYRKMGGVVTDIRAERRGYSELQVIWESLVHLRKNSFIQR